MANDSQFAKFANVFPYPIIALCSITKPKTKPSVWDFFYVESDSDGRPSNIITVGLELVATSYGNNVWQSSVVAIMHTYQVIFKFQMFYIFTRTNLKTKFCIAQSL